MYNYRFSPSALDKYQHLLDADAEFESDYNWTDEGPKLSLAEITAQREQELLDAINKVPTEPIEAADRGTAFNECVDSIIRGYNTNTLPLLHSESERVVFSNVDGETIETECEGFRFTFDRHLAERVASMLLEGTMQMHVQASIETAGGRVLLHGYPDYIMPTGVVDLKTTASYSFGKYANYWQRYTYPYILQATGLLQYCESFDFLVVEMKEDRQTGIISGEIYREGYTDTNLPECKKQLRWVCESFIEWIEAHRHQITNPQIFGNNE